MYHTTGFNPEEFLNVVECVERCAAEAGESIGYPLELGLYNSVRVAIIYLRRNTRQVELAEYHECSQATISRAIATVTPWIEKTFRPHVPWSRATKAAPSTRAKELCPPCTAMGAVLCQFRGYVRVFRLRNRDCSRCSPSCGFTRLRPSYSVEAV
jgi:hypothetical protein